MSQPTTVMTTTDRTSTATTPAGAACDPASRVTKSLLGYGVLAGPFYVVVSVLEGSTRDGFDFTRHAWSLLSNGHLGWIHVINFLLSGLMTIAFAVGLHRAYSSGRGSRWAPRLMAGYGLGLVGAGLLRADPVFGFPRGTPEHPAPSWHGIGHLVSGTVGFTCLIAACFVLARRFHAEGRRGWTAFSVFTGVAYLAAFIGIASGSAGPTVNVAFTAAVVLAAVWTASVAVHLYRRVRHGSVDHAGHAARI